MFASFTTESDRWVLLLDFKCAPPTFVSSQVVFSLAPPSDNRQTSAGSCTNASHQAFF